MSSSLYEVTPPKDVEYAICYASGSDSDDDFRPKPSAPPKLSGVPRQEAARKEKDTAKLLNSGSSQEMGEETTLAGEQEDKAPTQLSKARESATKFANSTAAKAKEVNAKHDITGKVGRGAEKAGAAVKAGATTTANKAKEMNEKYKLSEKTGAFLLQSKNKVSGLFAKAK